MSEDAENGDTAVEEQHEAEENGNSGEEAQEGDNNSFAEDNHEDESAPAQKAKGKRGRPKKAVSKAKPAPTSNPKRHGRQPNHAAADEHDEEAHEDAEEHTIKTRGRPKRSDTSSTSSTKRTATGKAPDDDVKKFEKFVEKMKKKGKKSHTRRVGKTVAAAPGSGNKRGRKPKTAAVENDNIDDPIRFDEDEASDDEEEHTSRPKRGQASASPTKIATPETKKRGRPSAASKPSSIKKRGRPSKAQHDEEEPAAKMSKTKATKKRGRPSVSRGHQSKTETKEKHHNESDEQEQESDHEQKKKPASPKKRGRPAAKGRGRPSAKKEEHEEEEEEEDTGDSLTKKIGVTVGKAAGTMWNTMKGMMMAPEGEKHFDDDADKDSDEYKQQSSKRSKQSGSHKHDEDDHEEVEDMMEKDHNSKKAMHDAVEEYEHEHDDDDEDHHDRKTQKKRGRPARGAAAKKKPEEKPKEAKKSGGRPTRGRQAQHKEEHHHDEEDEEEHVHIEDDHYEPDQPDKKKAKKTGSRQHAHDEHDDDNEHHEDSREHREPEKQESTWEKVVNLVTGRTSGSPSKPQASAQQRGDTAEADDESDTNQLESSKEDEMIERALTTKAGHHEDADASKKRRGRPAKGGGAVQPKPIAESSKSGNGAGKRGRPAKMLTVQTQDEAEDVAVTMKSVLQPVTEVQMEEQQEPYQLDDVSNDGTPESKDEHTGKVGTSSSSLTNGHGRGGQEHHQNGEAEEVVIKKTTIVNLNPPAHV